MTEKERKQRYAKNGKKYEAEHSYYLAHKDRIKQQTKENAERRKAEGWKRPSEYKPVSARRYYVKRKQQWIDALGGCCKMCGDKDIRHLTIDHINNDGHLEGHRRPPRYQLALSKADPTIYQVLCANCHADKHWDEKHTKRYK